MRLTGAGGQQLRVVGPQSDRITDEVFISGPGALFIAPGTDQAYLELRNDPSHHATVTITHSHENGGCGFIMQGLTTG